MRVAPPLCAMRHGDAARGVATAPEAQCRSRKSQKGAAAAFSRARWKPRRCAPRYRHGAYKRVEARAAASLRRVALRCV